MRRKTAQIRACVQADGEYYLIRDKPMPNWFCQAANPVAATRKRGGRSRARHYGFTEELGFIINYDIKYRFGREAEGEEA